MMYRGYDLYDSKTRFAWVISKNGRLITQCVENEEKAMAEVDRLHTATYEFDKTLALSRLKSIMALAEHARSIIETGGTGYLINAYEVVDDITSDTVALNKQFEALRLYGDAS